MRRKVPADAAYCGNRRRAAGIWASGGPTWLFREEVVAVLFSRVSAVPPTVTFMVLMVPAVSDSRTTATNRTRFVPAVAVMFPAATVPEMAPGAVDDRFAQVLRAAGGLGVRGLYHPSYMNTLVSRVQMSTRLILAVQLIPVICLANAFPMATSLLVIIVGLFI